jgi:DNA-binding winged helix-turn-helix (wHTH) protein
LASSPRYRFAEFVLSPRRRLLLRNGSELPLIPRYFDLLLYLVEHRQDAVHRRDIFDAVWGDVAVSDSALTQAIRTIRRVLGDDPREPTFLRTVSRHGYQFVFAAVVEEDDTVETPLPAAMAAVENGGRMLAPREVETTAAAVTFDRFEPLLARLRARALTDAELEEQRDAAERVHELGTADALRRLGTGPETAFARALLRDTPGTRLLPDRFRSSGSRTRWLSPSSSSDSGCAGRQAWLRRGGGMPPWRQAWPARLAARSAGRSSLPRRAARHARLSSRSWP